MKKKGALTMKIAVIAALIMVSIMNVAVFAEDAAVAIDKDQAIYAEPAESEPVETAATTLDEYGNMALEPIKAIKDTTNEFFNPQMELTYEAQADGADFTAEGPKFKMQF
jgi:hypothetical protein